MASFPDSAVPVTGYIGTTDPADTYATHVDILGWGGTMSVATISDRDAIPLSRRKFGMLVIVYADPTPANNKTYQLKPVSLGGIDNVLTNNSNWLLFGPSSAASFTNGLTENSGVVKLGGTLVNDTDITGAFALNLGLTGSRLITLNTFSTNKTVLTAGTSQLMLNDTSAAKLSGGTALSSYEISTAGALIVTDAQSAPNQRGIRGAGDYSANLQANDYTQKVYVDKTIVGKSIDAILANPSSPQNGYAIIWDQTNTRWSLGPAGSGGGGISDGDKGDITVTTGGTIWTIDNSVITNAKMANMAAFSFKGNATSGSAVVTDVGVENGLQFLSGKLRIGGTLIATTAIDGAQTFNIGATTPLVGFTAKATIAGLYGTANAAIEVYSNVNQSLRLGQTGGAILNLGSDATGDLYYRDVLGKLVRRPIGTIGQYFIVGANSIPIWSNTIIEDVGGPTYTFSENDNGKFKNFTAACTANIPTGLSLGWQVTVWRSAAAGLVTFTSSGALSGAGNSLPTAETAASIVHKGSDIHYIAGALTSFLSSDTFENGVQDIGGGTIQWGGPIINGLTELPAAVDGIGDLYIGTNAAFSTSLATVYINSTTLSAIISSGDAYISGAASTNIGDGTGVINLLTPGGNNSGDLFYLNASLNLVRRQIGTTNQFLQVVAGVPNWRTPTIVDINQVGNGIPGRTGGGTGALSVITVSNGLTLSASSLKLGGQLSDALTSISSRVAGSQLTFDGTAGSFVINANGSNTVVSFGNGGGNEISSFGVNTLGTISISSLVDNSNTSYIQILNGQIILNTNIGTSINNSPNYMLFNGGNAYSTSGNGNGSGFTFTTGTRRIAGTGVDGKTTFNSHGGFEVLSTSTQTTRTFKIDGFNDFILNLGSDADGDIYFRNGGKFVRLPKAADGTFLSLVSGLPAWVVGGGGGGVTNNASDTELTMSSSGNLTHSGLFIPTTADLDLGNSSTTGTQRTLQANGSSSAIKLVLKSKGTADMEFDISSGAGAFVFTRADSVSLLRYQPQSNTLNFGVTDGVIIGDTGISGSVTGKAVSIKGGDAYNVGNNNGGNVSLISGLANGSGLPGNIILDSRFNYTQIKGDRILFLSGTGGTNGGPYLSIGQRTANPPLTSGSNVVIYAEDSADTTVGLSLYTEQVVEALGTFTPTQKYKIQINGTWYWIQLDPV